VTLRPTLETNQLAILRMAAANEFVVSKRLTSSDGMDYAKLFRLGLLEHGPASHRDDQVIYRITRKGLEWLRP